MAKYLKRHEGIEVSPVFVADLWREHRLKPHRQDTFKLSRDPHFAEKVADIVGLYLAHLRLQWCCVSTRSPGVPGPYAAASHDIRQQRNGLTTTSGMAQSTCSARWTSRLEKSLAECYPRRGLEEFLAFMKTVAAKYVDREIHVVVDDLGTHFTAEVRDWLADNPNITLHCTPVGASWINQIEI